MGFYLKKPLGKNPQQVDDNSTFFFSALRIFFRHSELFALLAESADYSAVWIHALCIIWISLHIFVCTILLL